MTRCFRFGLGCAAVAVSVLLPARAELLPPGFRPRPLGVHALVGGKVVTKPGESLDSATILIRDGFIEAVGRDVALPADARVWDTKGLTIYAGFIEPYLTVGSTNAAISTTDSEPVGGESFTAGGVKFFGAPNSGIDSGQRGPGSQITKMTPSSVAA